MAGESDQERTLPPTPRRLEKAREEGRAVRSPELATALVLGSGGLLAWWGGPLVMDRMQLLMSAGLRFTHEDTISPAAMAARLLDISMAAWIATGPLIIALVFGALAAPFLLGGWLFSWQAVEPRFSRFDPIAGLGRIFSLNGLTELGKAVAKALLLTVVLALVLWTFREEAASLAATDSRSALAQAGDMLLKSFLFLVGAMALLAAIDVPLQMWRHHRDLRMTLQEVKDEMRETEGDPHIRMRIRGRQRDMARRRMMAAVPKADVVVTNPTHYAVALSYQEGGGARAPTVVAKGSGLIAQRIREIAAEHRVPTLEAPPLARALYRHAEIGDEIPAALYNAVAQVLAYVYQLRRHLAFGGAEPAVPQNIEVPAGMDISEAAS